MNEPIDLILAYARLEQQVQRWMTAQSRGACARCLRPCCRIEFCRESLESPFLHRVRSLSDPQAQWDAVRGWLTPVGCALKAGRPPVCYEFLCRDLEECQPTLQHREALRLLARLITEAGRCGRGKRHLIELNELAGINWRRLSAGLERASSSLERLRSFWEGGKRSPLIPG